MKARQQPPTVAEVIAFLQTLPPDTRVLVRGYEGGYNAAATGNGAEPFKPYSDDAWYYGDWDTFDDRDKDAIPSFVGVIL